MRPRSLGKIAAAVAGALGLALLLGAVSFGAQDSPAMQYETASVTVGSITRSISATGNVRPVAMVTVGSQVSGTVAKVFVDHNDKVVANQPLAQIDGQLYAAELQETRALLSSARSSAVLAETNYKRTESLFLQGMVSRSAVDKVVDERHRAHAQVLALEAKEKRDTANLEFTIIRSPVNGVVVEKTVEVGQTVAANFQSPILFRLAEDLKSLQLELTVLENDIGEIKKGQSVTFVPDAYPEKRMTGAVKQVRLTPVVQQGVVAYTVIVDCQNPHGELLPGMTVQAAVQITYREGVLRIPSDAVRYHPAANAPGKHELKAHETAVYRLVKENEVERVIGERGITDGRKVEFSNSKLAAGDLVVIREIRPKQNSKAPKYFRLTW